MTHDGVIAALAYAYPDAVWSYNGDGSTLDPVEDEDGNVTAYGLVWDEKANGARPTLATLEAVLPNLPPPPAPLDDQLATALAALPQDTAITGQQLTEVIALLRGAAPAALPAKAKAARAATQSKKG